MAIMETMANGDHWSCEEIMRESEQARLSLPKKCQLSIEQNGEDGGLEGTECNTEEDLRSSLKGDVEEMASKDLQFKEELKVKDVQAIAPEEKRESNGVEARKEETVDVMERECAMGKTSDYRDMRYVEDFMKEKEEPEVLKNIDDWSTASQQQEIKADTNDTGEDFTKEKASGACDMSGIEKGMQSGIDSEFSRQKSEAFVKDTKVQARELDYKILANMRKKYLKQESQKRFQNRTEKVLPENEKYAGGSEKKDSGCQLLSLLRKRFSCRGQCRRSAAKVHSKSQKSIGSSDRESEDSFKSDMNVARKKYKGRRSWKVDAKCSKSWRLRMLKLPIKILRLPLRILQKLRVGYARMMMSLADCVANKGVTTATGMVMGMHVNDPKTVAVFSRHRYPQ